MKKDKIITLFKRLENDFDTEAPNSGHQNRFLEKLQRNSNQSRTLHSNWSRNSFLAVAASIIICFGLFFGFNNEQKLEGLASVSPEYSKTQSFFSNAIQTELVALKAQRSPQTNQLIDDALKQLDLLEEDYKMLKLDLTESGNDKRVIYAMIANFQSRVDVLESVMQDIENLKALNHVQNTI